MIGDAPQPGETPRTEGDPWSFGDPEASWWRGETDRTATEGLAGRRDPRQQAAAGGTGTLLPPAPAEKTYTGEAATAHAAGARDLAQELDPSVPAEPVEARLEVPDVVEAPVLERAHDQADPHRYDPMRPAAGHIAKITGTTVAADAEGAPPASLDMGAADQPDLMILPELNLRSRPTVPLDRYPIAGPPPPALIPGQAPGHSANRPTEPLPRSTGAPHIDARLEKLENSPFWRDQPYDTAATPLDDRAGLSTVRTHRSRPKAGRLRVSAHVALVTLALLSAFFGWVSAEPFWLAVGHGDRGVATVVRCTSSGVTQRCVGQFNSDDGRYTVGGVTLLGVEPEGRQTGTESAARMVSPSSRQAYLGETGPLVHLRWVLGFALVLVCGYAVAGVTGARRLENSRARRIGVLLSLAGPFALLAGFLIAAY